MFDSPITLTLGGVAHSLNRINQDGYSSEYFKRLPNGELRLKIRNVLQKSKTSIAERHSAELKYVDKIDGIPVDVQSYFVFVAPQGTSSTHMLNTALAVLGFGTSPNVAAMADWSS